MGRHRGDQADRPDQHPDRVPRRGDSAFRNDKQAAEEIRRRLESERENR